MKKKETKTAEQKVIKYLMSRKSKIIKNINAKKVTGFSNDKSGANLLARLCKEGKLKRVSVGVYKLIVRPEMVSKPFDIKQFNTFQGELAWDKTPEAIRFFELNPVTKRYYFELMNKVKSKYKIYLPNLQDNWNFVADCFNSHTLLDDACEMVGHQDSTKPLKFNMNLLTKYPSLSPPQIPLPDAVNKPSHYTDGKIEVIDYIEDKSFGFHLGNVIKYVSRAGKKDPATKIQDLEKGRWYLDRIIANLKKQK